MKGDSQPDRGVQQRDAASCWVHHLQEVVPAAASAALRNHSSQPKTFMGQQAQAVNPSTASPSSSAAFVSSKAAVKQDDTDSQVAAQDPEDVGNPVAADLGIHSSLKVHSSINNTANTFTCQQAPAVDP